MGCTLSSNLADDAYYDHHGLYKSWTKRLSLHQRNIFLGLVSMNENYVQDAITSIKAVQSMSIFTDVEVGKQASGNDNTGEISEKDDQLRATATTTATPTSTVVLTGNEL